MAYLLLKLPVWLPSTAPPAISMEHLQFTCTPAPGHVWQRDGDGLSRRITKLLADPARRAEYEPRARAHIEQRDLLGQVENV